MVLRMHSWWLKSVRKMESILSLGTTNRYNCVVSFRTCIGVYIAWGSAKNCSIITIAQLPRCLVGHGRSRYTYIHDQHPTDHLWSSIVHLPCCVCCVVCAMNFGVYLAPPAIPYNINIKLYIY